jgi:acetyltransferase-like isoleucine patch superfamily enzyme
MARVLKRIKTEKGKSSEAWKKVVPLWKVILQWFVFYLAIRMPVPWKSWWYSKTGIKIGKNVQIMPLVATDIFFPNLISIGDNVVIGMDSIIICHEFTVDEFKYGRVKIEKDVLMGAKSFILPGITIGEGAMVSAQTVVYKDVPAYTLAFGSPLQFKKIGKLNSKK